MIVMISIGKAMKVASLPNPNYPLMAALFHSTSLLSLKKRTYWPGRSYNRGPPRLRFELVYKRSQVSGIIGKLDDQYFPYWKYWGAQSGSSQDFSKNSSSKSSKIALPADMTTADRLALGLPADGPLNLEDVKIAYRSCAVKWHPDHHQDFAKTFAEKKFKICNSAYRSLCDKLSSS